MIAQCRETISILGKSRPVPQDGVKEYLQRFGLCIKSLAKVDGGWRFVFEGTYTTGFLIWRQMYELARQYDARISLEGE